MREHSSIELCCTGNKQIPHTRKLSQLLHCDATVNFGDSVDFERTASRRTVVTNICNIMKSAKAMFGIPSYVLNYNYKLEVY